MSGEVLASRRKRARSLAPAAVLVAAAVGVLAPAAAHAANLSSEEWSAPGANAQNTRDVPGPIKSSNVGGLTEAWSVPIQGQGAFGTFASTPIITHGVVYAQDIDSNVYAINLQTGKQIWFQKYNSSDAGPNGITVDNGVVYGATATKAFAIQAATGEQLWQRNITANHDSGIDMAPGYNDGIVYVSTVPGNVKHFSGGKGQGTLYALNGKTGKVIWKWNEIQDWSKSHQDLNSGAGQWYPPSFDSEGNVYVGTANPAPVPGTKKFPFGSSRPGADLYTDSVVKLNGKTGKLEWYYQLTPHDIDDWDLEDPPIITKVKGQGVVLAGGKAGIVVALNEQTGALLWKRPVGDHNGHDHDGLLTLAQAKKTLKFPYTVFPGIFGGIESPMASDGTNVYAAVNNLGSTYTNNLETGIKTNVIAGKGEMVALNQANGKVVWRHAFGTSPYGSAAVTNDVVFTTTFNGKLWALSTKTGKTLWNAQMPAGTNAFVAIDGNTVVTAASLPLSTSQTAQIIAYRLPTPGASTTATSTPATR
jgi:outer membrane protein assembly factor BamB